MRTGLAGGVGLFVDEEGATTVAAAVAILVSLALVFGMATVEWVSSRSADIQAVADAGALAGMNAVAGYATAAQMVDAFVLSMGLVGMTTLAAGLVLSAIPLLDSLGPPVVETSLTVFDLRSQVATSAAEGLKDLEGVVPYLAMANSLATVAANSGDGGTYFGTATPLPFEGSSDFGHLSEDDVAGKVDEAQRKGDEVGAVMRRAAQAKAEADEALERGWYADCGGDTNLRERADVLAGLPGWSNPNYPASTGWNFGVPILRARAYYQQRLALEAPLDASPAETTRSIARERFYGYALEQVNQSSFHENEDGTVSCDLRHLPQNTSDVRLTTLYTEAAWPCTEEGQGRTLHSYAGCPGASGAPSGSASLADLEAGACLECPVCAFTVVDVGRAPAASTSIDNGFEHYWKAVVEASEDYAAKRAEQAALEAEAKAASEEAAGAFEEALERLSVTRVELSPPGRYGCICVVTDWTTHESPEGLTTPVSSSAAVPPRVAISGAVLARDGGTYGANVFASFFDGLASREGFVGDASSVLDGAMTAWGDALVAYGDAYAAFSNILDGALAKLSDFGMGSVSTWLRQALQTIVSFTGMQPADLSLKKPVLANSVDVANKAGLEWYGEIRALMMGLQNLEQASGAGGAVSSVATYVYALTGSDKITVAKFTVPLTGEVVTLDVDLQWLMGLGAAA